MTWERVTHKQPCEICGKPDWCTRSELGACCMRVETDRPMHNGGWLHPGDAEYYGHRIPQKTVKSREVVLPLDAAALDAMLDKWRGLGLDNVQWFASQLGLKSRSLAMLGACAWPSTLAIPMYDENGGTIGIRLRNKAGHKYAVKGSRQGIFVPYGAFGKFPINPCVICEGPTDTAAALEAGFFALGRASALGQEQMLRLMLRNLAVKEIVLCGDQDQPGQHGEKKLVATIGRMRVRRLRFPAKDLRAWHPTHDQLAFAIRQTN
jgi:hypothetical protein